MRRNDLRGYALLTVMLIGVATACLAAALLLTSARDQAESAQQMNTVAALYAAEGAVAKGVDDVRAALDIDPNPALVGAPFDVPPSLPNVTWDQYAVRYVVASTLQAAASAQVTTGTIASGPYAGLYAQRTPIEVFASARVNGSVATLSDFVSVDRIPVFQFAIFMDGDLEFVNPPPMSIKGRVHTNGNFHAVRTGTFSTPQLTFNAPITVAGKVERCLIASPSTCTTNSASQSGVAIYSPRAGVVANNPSTWPRLTKGFADNATAVKQSAYLRTTFLDNLSDASTGAARLNPPITMSGTPPNITSRPGVCADGSAARFAQSSGIEVIKRPRGGYTQPYTQPTPSGGWINNYGPLPGTRPISGCSGPALQSVACQTMAGGMSVPRNLIDEGADDESARSQRLYWEANIRIIDGIWYRRDNSIIFDPETWVLGDEGTPSWVLGHKFARVQRYSWFWDPRENRVYGSAPAYQRGLQMRVSDFDVQAFNELVGDSAGRALLFAGGEVPSFGVVVYISETHNASFEDANTVLVPPRGSSADVRNFLDFHIMENASSPPSLCKAPGSSRIRDLGLTACDLGWHPYYIWGEGAPAAFRSLTPSPASLGDPLMQTPGLGVDGNTNISAWSCREPMNPTFSSRDLSSTAQPSCVQAGATPLGAENAVRIVRANVVPPQGLTVATDNRLYLYGDVNVTTSGAQAVPGKVAFIADSIAILSQKFSDRAMQRGGLSGSDAFDPRAAFRAFSSQPSPSAATSSFTSESSIGGGNGPNLCTLWRALPAAASLEPRPRRPFDVSVHASLLMGDVPSCKNAGGGDGSLSGGVNNFPRFLEDFAGNGGTAPQRTVTILGSIVGLFRAEEGNARFLNAMQVVHTTSRTNWIPGRTNAPSYSSPVPDQSGGEAFCVYSAPARNWSFDAALLDAGNLPPGTPRLFTSSRLRWVRR